MLDPPPSRCRAGNSTPRVRQFPKKEKEKKEKKKKKKEKDTNLTLLHAKHDCLRSVAVKPLLREIVPALPK